MKTKNTLRILALVTLISPFIMKAQDSTKTNAKELYLSFGGFNPFNMSLKYKKQIREKMYFKVGLISLGARVTSNNPNQNAGFRITNENYSGGFLVGIEFRKALTGKLTLFHGPNISAVYNRNVITDLNPGVINRKSVSEGIQVSIPYTLGFLFHAYQNFFIAAEINPAISLYTQSNGNPDPLKRSYIINGGFDFDSRSANLSLVYRF
jgi:hypothetical protein